MAARCDKCLQLASDLFCGSRTPSTAAVLQHVDCTGETLDEILQGCAGRTSRKSICEYQAFAPEPLKVTTSALCLHREDVSYKLES